MRRRLLLFSSLLLLTALGGFWWWNVPEPLNETEKRLVGAWQGGNTLQTLFGQPKWGVIFLADRRTFSIRQEKQSDGTKVWIVGKNHLSWAATPEKIVERHFPDAPEEFSFTEWGRYLDRRWHDPIITESKLSQLTDDRFTMQGGKVTSWNMRRLTDPEILRIIQQLESGELP